MIDAKGRVIQAGPFAQAFSPSLENAPAYFAGRAGWGWGVNPRAVTPSGVSLP
jgi:hypothetical protein